ncbi:MAG: GtrA family protein [Burkholderiaceae bacterium]
MTGRQSEALRYLLNGGIATLVHFAVLWACMDWWHLPSAGLASAMASVAGIVVSFLGNRHYVFRRQDGHLWSQAKRFVALYAAIALLHGTVLYVWTDVLGLPYMAGFLIAVVLQVVLGYLGGRFLVFAAPQEHGQHHGGVAASPAGTSKHD